MHLPGRYVVDTALSIEDRYFNTDDLSPDAAELIEEIKALVGEFSFDTLDRDPPPMIERVPDDEMEIVEDLDALLFELRNSATRLFDDLDGQVMCSAEWWVYTGTPLASCESTDARTVIELQDIKHQVPDAFYDDVAELNRFDGLCALLLFGNDATTSELESVDFSSLDGLELLNLAENELERLPAGIQHCSSLRKLDVSDNINLHLDEDLAADWETPHLEELDIRDTFCTSGFVTTMSDKYPNLDIID